MKLHNPCQLENILQFLREFNCKFILDCTGGEGGHSIAVAKMVGESGRVITIEIDPTYFKQLEENAKHFTNITCVNANYTEIKDIIRNLSATAIDAILFDFGMSSYHLEESRRGFSFKKDEVLDMRFDPFEGEPLYAKIQKLSERDVELILKEFGEVRFRKNLAKNIFISRHKVMYTSDLLEIIRNSVPSRYLNEELPKIFQAFRIFINNEYINMVTGLKEAIGVLSKGGILITLSYHSVEDRLCKSIKNIKGMKVITKKPLTPCGKELDENPRCRSSKLRVFQKEDVDEKSLIDWYQLNLSLYSSSLLIK